MKSLIKDPLLAAAQIVIAAVIAIFGLVIALLSVALPAMLLNQQSVLAAIAEEGVIVGPELFGAASLVMILFAVILALAIWFLVLLRRIVNTVGTGDPFVSDNADRLARMGWIAIGVQILSLPLGALGLWLASVFEKADNLNVNIDTGVSAEGIMLVLVLFILARVFRHGTALRADLEGTV